MLNFTAEIISQKLDQFITLPHTFSNTMSYQSFHLCPPDKLKMHFSYYKQSQESFHTF